MAGCKSLLLYALICFLTVKISLFCCASDDDRKVYIVYMGSLPGGDYSPSSHHLNLLQEVVQDSSSSQNFLVASYKRSFNGFAAALTSQEAEKLASRKEVVSVFPSINLQLQTTRSWDFMGFNRAETIKPGTHSDIIVGVIDSGIWPESESFNDEGIDSPPKKWKGSCKGQNFTCNNKLIGARDYTNSSSARDDIGHGTHTASTAAGSVVKNVSFFGIAQGTARGGVPSARIAAYKVCSDGACQPSAILSAFDDAIADGVDVITISIGQFMPQAFQYDTIAVGAFHATEKGILTVQSGGNSGLEKLVVSSVAPWILTVAASSIDRKIIDKVILGNGKTLAGNSINSFTLNGTKFPLVYGKEASSTCQDKLARACASGCLDSSLVKGKIVLCDSALGKNEATDAGAAAAIFSSCAPYDVSFPYPLPALCLSSDNYDVVKSYVNSTKEPTANILKSQDIKDPAAPLIASFSSRGPNMAALDILKPDVSAPGVDILAAFVPIIAPTDNPADKRRTKYSILSGTSMACPHAAGIAAHVKASHPDWSPSAIKSAIMTTAWPMRPTTNSSRDGEFAYGSGHVNPVKAINPGLVYETFKDEYVQFLCTEKWMDERGLRLITGDNSTSCSRKLEQKDLNYPSMSAKISGTEELFTVVFHRTVTNVGIANSTYKAKVVSDSRLQIKVLPEVLTFKSLKETKSFDVIASGGKIPMPTTLSAQLVWSDGSHDIRSPIVVYAADI